MYGDPQAPSQGCGQVGTTPPTSPVENIPSIVEELDQQSLSILDRTRRIADNLSGAVPSGTINKATEKAMSLHSHVASIRSRFYNVVEELARIERSVGI